MSAQIAATTGSGGPGRPCILIQTLIAFDGTLSSWWTRIVAGVLLLAFCLLQRFLEARDPAR